MNVYVILENYNDYPENGGGLQGVVGVYNTQEEAEKICASLNDGYNIDNYNYFVLPYELNTCTVIIPQPKPWLDYWYTPYDPKATEFNEQVRKLTEKARTGKVVIDEKY